MSCEGATMGRPDAGDKMLFALNQKPEGLELTVQKHSSSERDMLRLTAEVFPQINVLWIGCLVMVIGTVMAIRHRYKISKGSGVRGEV
jgi:cytochrome c biogenesis factor